MPSVETPERGVMNVQRRGFETVKLTVSGVRETNKKKGDSIRVRLRNIDLRLSLLDTSGSSGQSADEELVRAARYNIPDDLVIATGAGNTWSRPRDVGRCVTK